MPGDMNFPGLGLLAWDAGDGSWSGDVELRPGRLILVVIDYQPGALSELDALRRARGIFLGLREHEQEYRRRTADEVDGMAGLTADEVHDFLTLSSLCVNVDGSATLDWDHEAIYHGVVTFLGRKGEFLWAELGG